MPPSQDHRSQPKPSFRGTLITIAFLVVLGLAVGFVITLPIGIFRDLPSEWARLIHAALVLIVGITVSRLLERRVFRLSASWIHPDHVTSLRYLTRLLLYTTIVLACLAAFGVGLPSLVFGGAFVTVVIGLAGQQVFANIIGGIWLIIFRPFKIGEFIGIVTWQFPILMPSFPHEAMRPAYQGRVRDINLMYTIIENGDGFPQVIPNGILVQAFIENRSVVKNHRVRLRFDVAFDVAPDLFVPRLKALLDEKFDGQHAFVPEVLVADLYPAAYSVIVMVPAIERDETVRSEVLSLAFSLMAQLRAV